MQEENIQVAKEVKVAQERVVMAREEMTEEVVEDVMLVIEIVVDLVGEVEINGVKLLDRKSGVLLGSRTKCMIWHRFCHLCVTIIHTSQVSFIGVSEIPVSQL